MSSLAQAVRITWRRRQAASYPRTFPPETGKGRPLLWAQPMLIHPLFTVITVSSNFVGGFCTLWDFLYKSRVQ